MHIETTVHNHGCTLVSELVDQEVCAASRGEAVRAPVADKTQSARSSAEACMGSEAMNSTYSRVRPAHQSKSGEDAGGEADADEEGNEGV